jgi:hypothetical protein
MILDEVVDDPVNEFGWQVGQLGHLLGLSNGARLSFKWGCVKIPMVWDILPSTIWSSSVDGRASPGTSRDIKMANLSDLSDELVHRVIDHILIPHNDDDKLKGCHVHLDHIQERPRAYLEHKNNHSHTSHTDNNHETVSVKHPIQFALKLIDNLFSAEYLCCLLSPWSYVPI